MNGVFLFTISCIAFIHLQAQTGCISGNCDNGNGTYKWDNGDMYSGVWVKGVRTGYGRYDWADGSYYVGNFKDGLLEGEGAYYAANGVEMVGWFSKNEYQGKEKPVEKQSLEVTGGDSNSDDGLEKLVADMEKSRKEDEEAQALAYKNARYYDFKTVAGMVTDAFATNFETLKGPEKKGYFDYGSSWYSNLFVNGTLDAYVNKGLFNDHNSWYCILYTGIDKADVMEKYKAFVNEFNEMQQKCCRLVYDTYDDYVTESYESYGTYWILFLTKPGYNIDIYKDIIIEIQMNSKILEKGYEIMFRVGYLSDQTSNND
jgi:hypothetical protein